MNKTKLFLLLVALGCTACGKNSKIYTLENLPAKSRYIVGEIQVRGYEIDRYTSQRILASYDPKTMVGITGDGALSDIFELAELEGENSFFEAEVKDSELYIRGLRLKNNDGVLNTYNTLYLSLRLPKKISNCEYIGTIQIQKDTETKYWLTIKSDLDAAKSYWAKKSQCPLKTNLIKRES